MKLKLREKNRMHADEKVFAQLPHGWKREAIEGVRKKLFHHFAFCFFPSNFLHF
jgi:hypothetical protein